MSVSKIGHNKPSSGVPVGLWAIIGSKQGGLLVCGQTAVVVAS